MKTNKNKYRTSRGSMVVLALAFVTLIPKAYSQDHPESAAVISKSSASAEKNKRPDASTEMSAKVISSGDTSPMTDDYFKLILDDLTANGFAATLKTDVAELLGLSPKGDTLKVRRDAFEDGSGGTHSIVSIGHDSGYVIACAQNQRTYYYRLDMKRALLATVSSYRSGAESPFQNTVIPKDESQKLLDREWMFWVDIALRLQATK